MCSNASIPARDQCQRSNDGIENVAAHIAKCPSAEVEALATVSGMIIAIAEFGRSAATPSQWSQLSWADTASVRLGGAYDICH